MLGLVLAVVLQASTPAPDAEAPAAAETEVAAQPAQETTTDESAVDQQRARRCTQRDLTGTRLSRVRTCRSRPGHQSEDTRRALEMLQRPPAPQVN